MLTPTRDPILHSEKFSDARGKLSLLFDQAVRDELPVAIERGGREFGLLVARGAMLRLLARFELHVDVLPEDGSGFTLWVRELDVGGTGPTLKEARSDLVAAIRDYARDYWQQFAFYRHLPDIAAKEPYVLRMSLADTEEELLDLLFGAAPAADSARETVSA